MNNDTNQTGTKKAVHDWLYHTFSSAIRAELSPVLLTLQRTAENLEKIANTQLTSTAENPGEKNNKQASVQKPKNTELTFRELKALRSWFFSSTHDSGVPVGQYAAGINLKLLGVKSSSGMLALYTWAGPEYFEVAQGRRLWMGPWTDKVEQLKPFIVKTEAELKQLKAHFKAFRLSAGLSIKEAAKRVSEVIKNIEKSKPTPGFSYGRLVDKMKDDDMLDTRAWLYHHDSPNAGSNRCLTPRRYEAMLEAYNVTGENLKHVVSTMPAFLIEEFKCQLPNSRIFTVLKFAEPLKIPAHIRSCIDSGASNTPPVEASAVLDQEQPNCCFPEVQAAEFLGASDRGVVHNTTLHADTPEMGKRFSIVIK